MLHLVLGGARSGKSTFAEQWLLAKYQAQHERLPSATQAHVTNAHQNITPAPIYIATAEGLDEEMQGRIKHHQAQRNSKPWQLIECPLELAALLNDFAETCSQSESFLLIDCLTLWLTNHLMAFDSCSNESSSKIKLTVDQYLHARVDELIAALAISKATMVVVSNEIGLGVVPMGKETRLFVDHAGWMNQKLAKLAQQVTLVTAGLPLTLKNEAGQHG